MSTASAAVTSDWMTNYYRKPQPERFVQEMESIIRSGALNRKSTQLPIVGFVSELMSQNPSKVGAWLDAFEDLDKDKRRALLTAAWYSDTDAARTYFQANHLDQYLQQRAHPIIEREVNNPPILEMLWGSFYANGDLEPVKRVVGALSYAKYSGALAGFEKSNKTANDKKAAYLDLTFKAALWSLEKHCSSHPRVLEHCKSLQSDPELNDLQLKWLAVVIARVNSDALLLPSDSQQSEVLLTAVLHKAQQ